MTFPRLGLLAAALALSSCLVPTAPEPADFKLSEEALARKYPAVRRAGTVRLYARNIATTRDQWGRETHQATGGALLVKASTPPILAEAGSISVTPAFSEVSGRSTVKKNDRLYLGQEESSTIRIDGGEIIPSGPVSVRRVAAEGTAPTATAAAPAGIATAPAVEDPAPQAAPPPALTAEPQQKPQTVARSRPRPRPQSRPAAAPAPAPASTPVPAPPAAVTQSAPAPARPATPPPAAAPAAPAAKPKAAPAPDPARVLNLMRDPTER